LAQRYHLLSNCRSLPAPVVAAVYGCRPGDAIFAAQGRYVETDAAAGETLTPSEY
jgi:hypothetical protein